ncbi:MAG: hypothetical protein AB1489_17250 [Acidobacteriota bacterium]
MESGGKTINEGGFRLLCYELAANAEMILEQVDWSDPQMNEKSALLMVLYHRLCKKLALSPRKILTYPDDPSHEGGYRDEIFKLLEFEGHMYPPFNCRALLEEFLQHSLYIYRMQAAVSKLFRTTAGYH